MNDQTFGMIIGAIVGLLIMYFVIKIAVKDAINEKLLDFFKVQTKMMRYQAKQNGMTDAEIDKSWMPQKLWDKTYSSK